MKKILLTVLTVGALAASDSKKVNVDDRAPDVTRVDERGNTVHLATLSGDIARWLSRRSAVATQGHIALPDVAVPRFKPGKKLREVV